MARCLNLDGSMPEARWLDAKGSMARCRWNVWSASMARWRLNGGLDGGLDGALMAPQWLDVGAQLPSPLQSVAYPLFPSLLTKQNQCTHPLRNKILKKQALFFLYAERFFLNEHHFFLYAEQFSQMRGVKR